MTSPNPVNSQAAYLPIDFQLPEDLPKIKEMINERERKTASIVNVKDIGIYQIAGLVPTTGGVENPETLNGQQFFLQPDPNAMRKATYIYRSGFDLVSLNGGVSIPASGAPIPFAHGLSPGGGTFTFTRIYGTATKSGPVWMPIPYASPTANLNIEVNVDPTNINITVGSGQGALTQCYIILEYYKA